jgi:predicted DsbA family dithiol-disulfide isomerase
MMQHLKNTAADLGLPLGTRETTYNSRLAQELGLWAESQNKGDAFHMAAFKAYFVDGKNIAEIPVLLDIATSVELSFREATKVIETRAFKNAVDIDWDLSRKKAITGVPAFVINNETLIGAQPYEVLSNFVRVNGVPKKITKRGESE